MSWSKIQPERTRHSFLLSSNVPHERSTSELAHAPPKQMEKLALEAARKAVAGKPTGIESAAIPAEYWDSVLNDPYAAARAGGAPIQQRRLSEIPRHVLRVACRRRDRIIEIQTAEAIRLYGEHANWNDTGDGSAVAALPPAETCITSDAADA